MFSNWIQIWQCTSTNIKVNIILDKYSNFFIGSSKYVDLFDNLRWKESIFIQRKAINSQLVSRYSFFVIFVSESHSVKVTCFRLGNLGE